MLRYVTCRPHIAATIILPSARTDGSMRSMPLLRLLLAAKAGGLSHQDRHNVIGENMGSL